jgi:hypothetical protein
VHAESSFVQFAALRWRSLGSDVHSASSFVKFRLGASAAPGSHVSSCSSLSQASGRLRKVRSACSARPMSLSMRAPYRAKVPSFLTDASDGGLSCAAVSSTASSRPRSLSWRHMLVTSSMIQRRS